MSSIVAVHGVGYELPDGRELFHDLQFSLDATVTALVGPNGIGKTCLARVLAGEIAPSRGVVRRNGAVRLLAQRELPPFIPVGEYLAAEYEWSRLGEELLRHIDTQTPCSALSGGQWMRVRLARSLNEDFVILDEPSNDLDREGRAAVIRFLQAHRHGVLLISHDRECLELCGDVLELSNRGLARYGGGWAAYVDAKECERRRLTDALERAKRGRDAAVEHRAEQQERQERRNRRGARVAASGGIPRLLAGARKRRAQVSTGRIDVSTLQQAEAAVREVHAKLSEMKVDPVMYADLFCSALPSQKLIAEAKGFNIRFRDWLYRDDLEFSWRGNVRIALQGANGAGKSTLLKAIQGAPFDTRGELRRGDLITLYLDQQTRSLDDSASVIDNVRAVSSATESEIRNGLARFLFARDAVFQRVSDLSGGERLRAALARAFLGTKAPELLLLDEPTNNLDLANIEFLEALVRDFPGALIVVSHDERFLANCSIEQAFVVRGSRYK